MLKEREVSNDFLVLICKKGIDVIGNGGYKRKIRCGGRRVMCFVLSVLSLRCFGIIYRKCLVSS